MQKKYDPVESGPFAVGVHTVKAHDDRRNRDFPCEIWYPAAAADRDAVGSKGIYPLILYSHFSTGNRRSAAFLCTHLASHGYVVAALDHSEVVNPDLARKAGETDEQKKARTEAIVANRVPDLQFLLDRLQESGIGMADMVIDSARVGVVGHSLGGWTALAMPEVDSRISGIVALAPGGASNPRPGILPGILSFQWHRDVPTLYLVAENDVPLPLSGMYELFDRTPPAKQMFILRRADHAHFVDNPEELHEFARKMTWPPELEWLQKEMKPFSELCSAEHAHIFVRALALAHFDATLKKSAGAQSFLAGDVVAELAMRGVEALHYDAAGGPQ